MRLTVTLHIGYIARLVVIRRNITRQNTFISSVSLWELQISYLVEFVGEASALLKALTTQVNTNTDKQFLAGLKKFYCTLLFHKYVLPYNLNVLFDCRAKKNH